MIHRKRTNQKGFTLVELMIATLVFSTILLATTTILIQLGRIYYKGVITNRTQETARSIADELSQQLQFGADKTSFGATHNYDGLEVRAFCIGDQRYSYVKNAKVNSKTTDQVPTQANGHSLQHALWRDTVNLQNGCTPLNLSQSNPADEDGNRGTNGRELLGQNMRLSSNFQEPQCAANGICSFTVSVLYGDDDLIQTMPNNPTRCGNMIGSQWCAASTTSNQVFKRLEQAD